MRRMVIAKRDAIFVFAFSLFLIVTVAGISRPMVRNSRTQAVLTPDERHRLNLRLIASASRTDDNYALFRQLLAQGADPNTRDYCANTRHTLEDSTTWLIVFSALGDVRTVKALLDHGANVNAHGCTFFGAMGHGEPDPHGSTALIDACCRSNNWDVIQLLLQHGADVNARDKSGNTPLGMAVWQCEWDECRLLLRHGARRELMNKWERSALRIYARQHGWRITRLWLTEIS